MSHADVVFLRKEPTASFYQIRAFITNHCAWEASPALQGTMRLPSRNVALVLRVTVHLYLTPTLSLPPSLTPIGILLKCTPSVNRMPQIPSWALLLEPELR